MATVGPSVDELITVGTAELQTRRADLAVADGDLTEAFLHVPAAMADAIIRDAALKFKNTFVDGATGDDLTTLVDDHYNLQRQEATSATATVAFTLVNSTAVGGTIPSGTQVATTFDASGSTIVFTTNANVTVSTVGLGPYSVAATATTAGRVTNVVSSTITRVIDQPTDIGGGEMDVTVTNTSGAAGGNDQETDEELRERVRSYFQTLRRGTLASLETGAKEVAEVRVATATEDANGLVTLYVADSDGNSSAEMLVDVTTEIVNWRAAGTTLSVVGGDKTTITMAITVSDYRVGFDVTANATQIQEAVAGRINKLQVGDTLYLDSVIHAAIQSFPDDIYNITITQILRDGVAVSITDLTAATNEVMRAGTITAT